MSDVTLRVADSITRLGEEFAGTVLVAGSHGGRYCGYLAALAGLRGVILNDAGAGKDGAGTGALVYLQHLGVPAATVAHTSAKIGNGDDMLARGLISQCNDAALALGCVLNQPCRRAAENMGAGAPFSGTAPEYAEARFVIAPEPLRIIGCDSASLVKEADAGALIITGSHGGVLAGRPGYGIAAEGAGAVFNDAGVGIDNAGVQRLVVLENANIPALTVSAESARIGDARSAWEDGIISYLNPSAEALGVVRGQTVPAFAQALREHLGMRSA